MATYCSPDIKIGGKGVCMSRNDHSWKNWLITALLLALLTVGITLALNQFRGVRADSSPAELRQLHESLLADPSSVSGSWLRTLNPVVKDVQGDLVWNGTQQQGVLRIRDLPTPKTGTFYQLWLYDARSTSAEAVSGSILRQGSGREELFAPIKAAVPILEPYKFELKLQADKSGVPGQILLMVQP